MDDFFDDDEVDETQCVSSPDDNFLLLPEHRERLEKVIRIQLSLDPNRGIPAFGV